ncbi:hypothetical protein [Cellulomonas endophytica]|uniref:hypothetical protein n=1 Tax=Cellulomonas endophytica TaxID=2494735 RepID=UPI0010111E5F|nr:hypothetical protein [Cellulomonas endophytica]
MTSPPGAVPSAPAPSGRPRTAARRLVLLVQEHPRPALALRAAAAAAAAWWLARVLPGTAAADYPYYAPMGAVIASSTTLAGSARESSQAVVAIALGGGIGLLADLAGDPGSVLVVALAVAGGVLAAGWRWLGANGSWVPVAALFTLVVGAGEGAYVGAYAGLTLLGALVGTAVVLLLPPLPVAPARAALATARRAVGRGLAATAELLEEPTPPDAGTWRRHRVRLDPDLAAARREVALATEGARANPRARRRRDDLAALVRQADVLARVARLVDDVVDLLTEEENRDVDVPVLGPALRPPAARVLRATAEVLATTTGGEVDPEAAARARAALADLVARTDAARRPDLPAGGTLAAGGLATAVRRCLDAVGA